MTAALRDGAVIVVWSEENNATYTFDIDAPDAQIDTANAIIEQMYRQLDLLPATAVSARRNHHEWQVADPIRDLPFPKPRIALSITGLNRFSFDFALRAERNSPKTQSRRVAGCRLHRFSFILRRVFQVFGQSI